MTANVEIPDKSFWDELEKNIRVMPTFPELEFQKDGVKYTVTDIRYLDKNGVNCFLKILNNVIENGEIQKQEFEFPSDIDENVLQVIIDIVMQIGVTAENEDGDYVSGAALVAEVQRNNTKVVFRLLSDHAKILSDIGRKIKKRHVSIDFFELMLLFADALMEDMCNGNLETDSFIE